MASKNSNIKAKKNFWLIRPVHIMLMIITAVSVALLYFLNIYVFAVMAVLSTVVIGFAIYKFTKTQYDIYKLIKTINTHISELYNNNLVTSPISSLIINQDKEIVWYNDTFKKVVLKDKTDVFGENIEKHINLSLQQIQSNPGYIISYNDKYFETYAFETYRKDNSVLYMLYMIDVTELQKTAIEHRKSQPVVMILLIDSYDETIRNLDDTRRSLLLSEIQRFIQDMADDTNAFLQRLHDDRYVLIMQKQYSDKLKEGRFEILDKVKSIVTEERFPITLSIGMGTDKNSLAKAQREARQALDMALGRGGDQVAVKTGTGYEFYGGVSKGMEKRTKVKTRIVANAMAELINQSDNVIIMGHKYADLDCLGSAIGMAKACSTLGRPANIVIDLRKNLANCLVNMVEQKGSEDLFVSPEQALSMIGEKTLCIVVDTHSQVLVESTAIMNKCKNIIVIDHHRKLVNYIDNAVVFYHEPYASSASEMVTELVQYFGEKCRLTHVEAESLLAGIMLDTRNFIIKTGVRTFEAAAYLRKLGADTVEVRKLFASTMNAYQQKTRVVSSAEIYNRCAIAICDFTSDDIRVITSQAADELLGISGVDASFVIYEQDDTVNVSARSMGELNVQVIMEKLGGGGHHTMAAAQIKNTNSQKVRHMLLELIDDCYNT